MRPSFVRHTLAGALVLAAALAAPRADLVERFETDPLAPGRANAFFGEGDAAARFRFVADEPSRFPGDKEGTLRVLYDTTVPTARLSTPIGTVVTLDGDFSFGAILTIRSEGFFASRDGFSQIAFGLWNAATTGMNRTGFPSDAYDLAEFDYFPNVTSFGGPFLTPTLFGGNVGGNAFNNFAFASKEATLPLDEPLLCRFRYTALDRRLVLTVSRRISGVFFEPISEAGMVLDLSALAPTFHLNVAGIAGYFEGYPSIRAEVDYDLLFVGPVPAPYGIVRRRTPGR